MSKKDDNLVADVSMDGAKLDLSTIAAEILDWLIAHVEEYIDNKERTYRIYFTNESLASMPHTTALKTLYDRVMASQDDVACTTGVNKLSEVTGGVYSALLDDKVRLEQLFKRLSYYYDMKLVRDEKGNIGTIIKELDGLVQINEFVYEPISQEVKVYKKMPDRPDSEKELVKHYEIGEGFAMEFELQLWDKLPAASML